jgi:quercetin dioxygenase-like cupin family protein
MPVVRADALPGSATSQRFEGFAFGDVGVSFFVTDAPPGTGPKLHRHPYAEVFVVQEGRVTFTVDGETIEAGAGDIVIAPAGSAHKFVNVGPGRSRHLDIHPSERMLTDWLEE